TLDYDALNSQLKLNGAIVIQPLDAAQIDAYLHSLGPEMATVRGLLQKDETIREMSQSPLMLSIMTLAYRGAIPPLDSSGSDSQRGTFLAQAMTSLGDASAPEDVEAQRRRLIALYVGRMFERRGGDAPYSQEQTIHYLSWLAQNMVMHGMSVFHIERLQPS